MKISRRLLSLILPLALSACGPVKVSPTPQPPSSTTVASTLSIHTIRAAHDDTPLPQATGVLIPDHGTATCITDPVSAWITCQSVADKDTHGGWLTISAPDFKPLVIRVPLVGEVGDQGLDDARHQAHETGWLRRVGSKVVTEDGQTWRGKGHSGFLLLQKYCDGQNIEAFLDDVVADGANYIRVLGMYDGGLGVFRPQDYGDRYFVCVDGLFNKLAERRLRGSFAVFADAQNSTAFKETPQQQAWLLRVNEHLRTHWNIAFAELVNEYWNNGVNPRLFSRPPSDILWANGIGQEKDDFTGDGPGPYWDVVTHHSSRSDEWPRKIECRAIIDTLHVPCFEDEMMGASETNQPGHRSNNADDFGQAGGLCALWATGCLFHSDGGILTEPDAPGSKVAGAAAAFFQGLDFAPNDAPNWPFQRGDNCGNCAAIGNMPLAQVDQPRSGGTLRTACRPAPDGHKEYCVVVRPDVAWVAEPRDGWVITSRAGANGVLMELTR